MIAWLTELRPELVDHLGDKICAFSSIITVSLKTTVSVPCSFLR